jgi:hypothetical protein
MLILRIGGLERLRATSSSLNMRNSAVSAPAAEVIVETLVEAGVRCCHGIVGDTLSRLARLSLSGPAGNDFCGER